MTMRLMQERARRQRLDPMSRYLERHDHLLLGRTTVSVTVVPAPAPAPAAEPEAPAAPEITEVDRARRRVCVFPPEPLTEAIAALGGMRDQDVKRLKPALTRAARDDGWRSVPWAGPDAVADPFADCGPQYENFRAVIDYLSMQWTCASHAFDAGESRLDPILLVGPPGMGKTRFAQELARRMGTRMAV